MHPVPGQPAPDFNLFSSEKIRVSLYEQRGENVLLLFYPQAFSSVCTAELCNVRDNLTLYNQLDARVFAISVDSVYTLAKFKADQRLNFTLLSDFNKETSAAYGVLMESFSFDMRGVSMRAAFVIDRMGIVKYAEVLENVKEQPDFEAINKTLEGLP
ncbi:redoxin domain-containing protein [Flavihumibacter petaseus]|uniref:Peroxiredoxin n=1 Tax=Flavihumibacter petaseus NBRC 106054 TaxID=1220578 RepID=A0A0E9MUQ3_9BACT|nr:peroxiredoxin [Flavihumibacter petaseus]GAO41309.1 peroxiredoxin [Flavihumibacter petaseus NBRC 106054]